MNFNHKKYIVAINQGTTSSRTVVLDRNINLIGISYKKISPIYPKVDWVEYDPMEIFLTQHSSLIELISQLNIDPKMIASIGISNQRETAIVWNKKNGKPIYNAISWQCRRTKSICNRLIKKGLGKYIKETTGLIIDPYFFATKVKWILDHVENAWEQANKGELLCGTVDSWLVWKMTNGALHVTDYTNASRTMLYDIHKLKWDDFLLEEIGIPKFMLPKVFPSSKIYGEIKIYDRNIPISAIIGDQQASLYGHFCVTPGSVKNTYGTGCFLLMNTGNVAVRSNYGLITTIACGKNGEINYALEGVIFSAGSAIRWLRDKMRIVRDISDVETYANSVENTGGIYIVPSFSNLGSFCQKPYSEGAIFGITYGSSANHIVRAVLESIAFQTYDLVENIKQDSKKIIKVLRVDGGMSTNNFLMQFQSDILGILIKRPVIKEVTSLGTAYLAGLAVGFWDSLKEIQRKIFMEREFYPTSGSFKKILFYQEWKKHYLKFFSK